ncbi:ribose-phosphate diphosphokinase [Candidatus Uhrbacteria bacterium]|nr:MAG: ribose-phosphate diphosphokinase [Candidatus Uhrbacteria bacterium]
MARRFDRVITLPRYKATAIRVANVLRCKVSVVTPDRYPSGESKLTVPAKPGKHVLVVADVRENPAEPLIVASLAEGLRANGAKRVELLAPWIGYGRQDHVAKPGETPCGVVIGYLLGGAYDRIVTLDAHSERFVKAFQGALTNVLAHPDALTPTSDMIVAPDRGATARAKAYAKRVRVPFIVIEKRRMASGAKKATLPERADVKGKRILIVDDMTDSGGTLRAAADTLRKAGATRIDALVSHSFDVKALKARLGDALDSTDAAYDHATNALKPWAFDRLISALQ